MSIIVVIVTAFFVVVIAKWLDLMEGTRIEQHKLQQQWENEQRALRKIPPPLPDEALMP